MAKTNRKELSAELARERTRAYVAVGEYIVHFEMMLNSIRSFLKESAAIKAKLDNDRIMDILLHDSTASSLLSYFKAFVYELFPEQMRDKEVSDYLKQIFKEVETAYQMRNDIAHASYMYGFYEKDEIEKKGLSVIMIARKFKVYKEGLQDVYHNERQGVIDFAALRNASIKLSELDERINFIIIQIGSTKYKLSDQEGDIEMPKRRKKRQFKPSINLKTKDIISFE
ncbi:MAG TPA: hypothetical protein VK508_00740 [Cyclobacteriaceae bacterium]|nr:hypothetical protein [Cyclobacteriaceae bacterium]